MKNKKMDLQELNSELEVRIAEGNIIQPEETVHRRRKKRKLKKKPVKAASILLIIVGIFLAVGVIFAGSIFFMQRKGAASLHQHEAVEQVEISVPEEVIVEDDGTTILYNGTAYQRNENIISILCMGIDTKTMETEGKQIGEGGQADTVFVVTLDTVTGAVKMINISRDAMVDVDIFNVDNEYVTTSKMQICLAYAYGDGKESSCNNMIKSVSRLLYGMPIDAYAAIDMPAIGVLNDAIGGVEVEVLEDLTDVDPELVKGARVLLQGDQARTYVRSRDMEVESNNVRMARQRQYLSAFIDKALAATKEDITVPVTMYQAATEYMVTDIDTAEVTYLASLVLKNGFNNQDMLNVPGESKLGEVHAEYHVDDKALYEMILDVYYTKVN